MLIICRFNQVIKHIFQINSYNQQKSRFSYFEFEHWSIDRLSSVTFEDVDHFLDHRLANRHLLKLKKLSHFIYKSNQRIYYFHSFFIS
jgi:hypothetical protein